MTENRFFLLAVVLLQAASIFSHLLIPDLSAWVRLGRHFRLGVGAAGLANLGSGDGRPIVFGYAAGKCAGTF
jgi:hypothetical protein